MDYKINVLATGPELTTIFGFCLIGLFFWRSLHIRLRLQKVSQ